MPSLSLQAFFSALEEVKTLRLASHPSLDRNAPESLSLARAVGRGQIVLLVAHFERYIYALNEELVSHLNRHGISAERYTDDLRLQHSMSPIDDLAKTGWEHRGNQLKQFVLNDGWLWGEGLAGEVIHDRLLTWMKTPSPRNLTRYFKLWGREDIFSAITRKESSRNAIRLGVQGLIDLRNNIAHGDYGAQATQSDVKRLYREGNRLTVPLR